MSASPQESCDCLNRCGDDYRVEKGQVKPCDNMLARRERERVVTQQVATITALRQTYGADNVFELIEKMHASVEARNADIARLEPLQYRPAPCHKFCEATAFEIEARGLKANVIKLEGEAGVMRDLLRESLSVIQYIEAESEDEFTRLEVMRRQIKAAIDMQVVTQ